MEQKKSLLTLDKCINKGKIDCENIINMFNNREQVVELKKLHKFGMDKIPYEEAIKKIDINANI
jgi:hypothetical protein